MTYKGMQGNAKGYKGMQRNTKEYKPIQRDTYECIGIQGIHWNTKEYKGMQRKSKEYKGMQRNAKEYIQDTFFVRTRKNALNKKVLPQIYGFLSISSPGKPPGLIFHRPDSG